MIEGNVDIQTLLRCSFLVSLRRDSLFWVRIRSLIAAASISTLSNYRYTTISYCFEPLCSNFRWKYDVIICGRGLILWDKSVSNWNSTQKSLTLIQCVGGPRVCDPFWTCVFFCVALRFLSHLLTDRCRFVDRLSMYLKGKSKKFRWRNIFLSFFFFWKFHVFYSRLKFYVFENFENISPFLKTLLFKTKSLISSWNQQTNEYLK